MTVLVTGGCGYIGAHVVHSLREHGESVVVADDLSTGFPERIAPLAPVVMDLSADDARSRLAELMSAHDVNAVIHLAALKQVAESMHLPTTYVRVNVASLANVLDAANDAGVPHIVFSSSAAVYGDTRDRVSEDAPTNPLNPYGESKLVGEWLVADAVRAFGLSATSLRYFNVAGAGEPSLGDVAIANLIPMVINRIAEGKPPQIFGDDYPTADGTCIRDYIHVADLAEAHVASLNFLRGSAAGTYEVLNVGTGHGASVGEMVEAITAVAGSSLEPELTSRRPGDPAMVVADVEKITRMLGWTASRTIRDMVESAWEAHQQRTGNVNMTVKPERNAR